MAKVDPSESLKDIYTGHRGINPHTLEEILVLAVEIAREGRERDARSARCSSSLWLLRQHGLHLKGPYSARVGEGMAVASKTEGPVDQVPEGTDK